MSGHVAQVFRDDQAWARVVEDLHRALVPHGTLAFESRNPAAKAWERWTRDATLRTLDTPAGPGDQMRSRCGRRLSVVSLCSAP